MKQKTIFAAYIVTLVSSMASAQAPQQQRKTVNWAQPPLACIEEAVPHKPNRACLDLSGVNSPQLDWPELPPADLAYWKSDRRALQYCRGQEVIRRERATPGTFSPVALQVAWMQVEGVEGHDEKVNAIYEASRKYSMPAHVLTGALYQESMFVRLGITEDGGNFSCGVGQTNINEWCKWANAQSAAKKKQMAWPSNVSCSALPAGLIRPFHQIALTRLNGLPSYRITKQHFANIAMKDVVAGFPQGDAATQRLRYQAASSFIANCDSNTDGIAAKANELASLYRMHVPAGLKNRERYENGQRFNRSCRQRGHDALYPMHVGWLLAVASYNAGPRAIDAMAFYNGWSKQAAQLPVTFQGVTPVEVVESLYWTGKYNPADDKIHFKTFNNVNSSWLWFKACVLQRHVARVVQHVVQSGVQAPVDTLEGVDKCAKSVFDQQGRLVKSSVPAFRQKSPGVKNPAPAPAPSRHQRRR